MFDSAITIIQFFIHNIKTLQQYYALYVILFMFDILIYYHSLRGALHGSIGDQNRNHREIGRVFPKLKNPLLQTSQETKYPAEWETRDC